MPRVIAFDVNETLLDLASLDPLFERLFGDGGRREQWFALMLQLSFVGGLTGRYVDFPSAQRAALAMPRERFDAILSADQVRALKPQPAPYHLVARTFGAQVDEVTLVAAHAWDVAGALAAGAAAAFVARPGKVLSPLGAQPEITGSDLLEVAEQLCATVDPA